MRANLRHRMTLAVAGALIVTTLGGCAAAGPGVSAPSPSETLTSADRQMIRLEDRVGCQFDPDAVYWSAEGMGTISETCPVDGAEVDLVYFDGEDAYARGYSFSRTHVAYYEHEFAAASDDAAVIARIEAAFASW